MPGKKHMLPPAVTPADLVGASPSAPETAPDPGGNLVIANTLRHPVTIVLSPVDGRDTPERTAEEGVRIGTPKTITIAMATKHPTEGITRGETEVSRDQWAGALRNPSTAVLVRQRKLFVVGA